LKRLPAVLAAAALLLALALAAPVGATTLVATLGDRTTYFNHFGDPARGQVRAYAQGQVLDLDDNGSADALRGKGGLVEVRGVLRVAIYDLELQVLRDGAFVPVAENTSEVNSGGVQPARATQWTPYKRFCAVPGLPDQTYRVRHLDGIRWNDNTFSSRTTYSRWFSAYPLEDDPSCVAPPPGPSATLRVSVSDSPDPVLNGERVTYTVQAGNAGPDIANGARLVVDTDERLDAPQPTAPAGVVCTVTDLDPSTGVDEGVVCDLGALSAGEEVMVTVAGTATGPTTAPIAIETVAVLTSTSSYAADADDSESTTVSPAADLSLVKTAIQTPPTTDPANHYEFTFAISNAGPNVATGAVVTDWWPAHLADPVSVSTGCVFDDANDLLSCSAAPLVSGASTSFTVVAPVLSAGTNTATVAGWQADPDRADNTDSATVTLGP
jgi:uncharacterized repeat protein (TIGR01451 family)